MTAATKQQHAQPLLPARGSASTNCRRDAEVGGGESGGEGGNGEEGVEDGHEHVVMRRLDENGPKRAASRLSFALAQNPSHWHDTPL